MIYENWEWPQWFFAVCIMIVLFARVYMHGKEIKTKISGVSGLINAILTSWILYMGGFWS